MGRTDTGRKCCGPDGRRLSPAHGHGKKIKNSPCISRPSNPTQTISAPNPNPQTLSPAMAQILPGPGARAPPPLPYHLVEEILVRVTSPADLARAAAACASFRRLVADASFLRRYRSLHPPLLLGILTARRSCPPKLATPTRSPRTPSSAPPTSPWPTSLRANEPAGFTPMPATAGFS
jgi:hypothetical protein